MTRRRSTKEFSKPHLVPQIWSHKLTSNVPLWAQRTKADMNSQVKSSLQRCVHAFRMHGCPEDGIPIHHCVLRCCSGMLKDLIRAGATVVWRVKVYNLTPFKYLQEWKDHEWKDPCPIPERPSISANWLQQEQQRRRVSASSFCFA